MGVRIRLHKVEEKELNKCWELSAVIREGEGKVYYDFFRVACPPAWSVLIDGDGMVCYLVDTGRCLHTGKYHRSGIVY